MNKLLEKVSSDENVLWNGKQNVVKVICDSFFNVSLILLILWGYMMNLLTTCMTQGNIGAYLVIMGCLFGFGVVLYLLSAFLTWLSAKYKFYMVTDKAVYIMKGVITTTIEMKPYIDIAHVNEKLTFADKVLKTGSIELKCAGSKKFVIKNIKEYEKVFDIVNKYQQDALKNCN